MADVPPPTPVTPALPVASAIPVTPALPKLTFGQWIWANTDPLTKWLQVIALIAGGLWGLLIFEKFDVPRLDPNAVVSISVSHWEPAGDQCNATFNVDVRNEGAVGFDIKSVIIRMWQAKLDNNESPDFETWEEQHKFFKEDVRSKSRLAGHFAPQFHQQQTFTYALPTLPAGEVYDVNAEIQDKNGHMLGRVARKWQPEVCVAPQ